MIVRLRVLLIFVGLVLALTGITPAHAEECVYADECVTISGTFWIDDNVDGIRQPSEKASPYGVARIIVASDEGNNTHVEVDEEGRFRYTRVYARASFILWGYHTVPGYSVREFRKGGGYTHFGKACFYVPQGSTEITADIRLLHYSVEGTPPTSVALADGYFFKETSGELYRGCDSGFAVTNAGGIALWDTWQRLGLESVGFPISHRFRWRGFVTQAFQKAIVQWRPGRGAVFVNIFDELYEAGFDDELRDRWGIPQQLSPPFESAMPVDKWEELGVGPREKLRADLRRSRLALLDANQAIKDRYFAAQDPLLRFGLPMSRVEDYGNVFVIRTQKAVFQQWKEEVPWAKAGEVTIANGGDIARAVDATCEHDDTSRRCTHLFFSEVPLENQDPVALIPQHIDLIDPP